jgi:hypothetical protein
MRRWLVVLLALAFTLAACGRVGPPVRSRPEPAPAVQPAASATPAAPNEQTEEEEKR